MLLTLPGLLEAGGRDIWGKMREKYLLSFRSQQVAEFGNAVSCVGKILKVCPEEETAIIPLLLNIDGHTFLHHGVPSPECRNVAKGHILECFLEQFPGSAYREEMAAFAECNLENDRKQVCARARPFGDCREGQNPVACYGVFDLPAQESAAFASASQGTSGSIA